MKDEITVEQHIQIFFDWVLYRKLVELCVFANIASLQFGI